VNFSQLRKQAEQLNIPGYSRMRKSELEEAIAAAQVIQAQTLSLDSVPLQ
jgi:hypothetical protein